MSWRAGGLRLLCTILLVLAWSCGDGERRPRNVVLITIDTLRADYVGCYGYARAHTPHLDALAAEGVRFAHAFSTINTTLASHAAMLSGLHPQAAGVPRNSFPVPPDVPLVAEQLRAAGYTTAAFVSASALHSGMGLDRGFDLYDERFTFEGDQEQRRAETTTRAVLAWLERQPPEPFFLWVHYFDPHYPYSPPAPFDTLHGGGYRGRADGSMDYLHRIQGKKDLPRIVPGPADLQRLIDLYDGEIAYLDAWLGPLLADLGRPERRASTLLILAADHGESMTEHDYFFDHGLDVYQPAMGVPFLVRCPPSLKVAPRVVDEPVQTHSIAPTIIAYAGLPVFEECQGRNLLPLLCGEPVERRLAFGEASKPAEIEESAPDEYRNLYKAQMVIDYPWKLVLTPYQDRVELFNLEADPDELRSLTLEEPARVGRMSRAVLKWREGPVRRAERIDPENERRLRSLGYIN
ncbi:MAG: sulfatase [Candidatus Eisenbacteria sp.]|nr:sulfatase [Candidatus Eisenbacteria bacterium]